MGFNSAFQGLTANQLSTWSRVSASQEIRRILWNLKVHFHIHKIPQPIPFLSQFIQSTPRLTSLSSTLVLSSYIRFPLPSNIRSSDHSTKTLYATLLFPIRAKCPNHLILLEKINRISDEKYIHEFIFNSWFRATQFNVNKTPTRCNSMQIFIHCKVTLHVSGVTAPIIRSTKKVAVTVSSTPDDGCCDTRNM